jgi:hypothetical protein
VKPRGGDVVAVIEERPISKESLAAHYLQNMTDEDVSHPFTGDLSKIIKEAAAEEDEEIRVTSPPPSSFESMAAALHAKSVV